MPPPAAAADADAAAAAAADADAAAAAAAAPPPPPPPHPPQLYEGMELADSFAGLACADGLMTVAGFGSLLSEASARYTFPELRNFRLSRLRGWRRVFAHACAVFFERGTADAGTREVSSLSVEEAPPGAPDLVVTLFEVAATPANVAAFVEREFRFVAVRPRAHASGADAGRWAVACARSSDAAYRAARCPPAEWARRCGGAGFTRASIWRDGVLPCRAYLRHCVLAARRLGREAEGSFLDGTLLADRATTVRAWLAARPGIMDEAPPPELAARYGG